MPYAKEEIDRAQVKWYKDPQRIHPPFVKLVQLLEIIAETMHVAVGSKRVQEMYAQMIGSLGPELEILLVLEEKEIALKSNERIAEGIMRARKGDISISPGFDGEYGKVSIWNEPSTEAPQLSLDL